MSSVGESDTLRQLGHPYYDRDSEAAPWRDADSKRPADDDRAGGRNTMTRQAAADLCTPGVAGGILDELAGGVLNA